MILQTAVLSFLLCSAQSFTVQASSEKTDESSGNTIEDDEFSVSTLIEKANANLGKNPDEPLVMFGDIAMPTDLGNADPCTAQGCLWPKATDGKVYVPYLISEEYSCKERETIIQGLRSFAEHTCIRFIPFNGQKDYLHIQSLSGCYSYIGRRGKGQELSLRRKGCIHKGTIQHELLHALGFDHEQTRSDRDKHVQILLKNVRTGMEHNFRKIKTRNLRTPYDYNSVMHYGRYAFSKNREPTIIPIPDPRVDIGKAKEMNPLDILRVNLLYRCNFKLISKSRLNMEPVQRNQFL